MLGIVTLSSCVTPIPSPIKLNQLLRSKNTELCGMREVLVSVETGVTQLSAPIEVADHFCDELIGFSPEENAKLEAFIEEIGLAYRENTNE